MARGKQQQEKKDGQHRKETKEEKRKRLQQQQEAKEQCLKVLPFVGAAVVLFLLAFGLYVRSVPAVEPKVQKLEVPQTTATGSSQNIKVAVENDGTVVTEDVDGETMEL